MLKTISAALLAVSVLAAPALAAAPSRTAQVPPNKTTHAPVIKAQRMPSKVLNANASMGRHHQTHYRHHHHHKHMGMLRTHATPKFAIKHIPSTARRG